MALSAAQVNTLFTEVGTSLNAGDVNDAANKTDGTVPITIRNFLNTVGLDASDHPTSILDSVSGAAKAISPLLAAGQAFNSAVVQTPIQNLTVQTIKLDTQLPNDSSLTAVRELIRQMKVTSPAQTLDSNTPATTDPLDTGTHTGANNASELTDSAKTTESRGWKTNSLVGLTVNNTTDNSSGTITANTSDTITATLSGGTDDDWDSSDAYTITGAVLYGTDFNVTSASSANNGDGILNASITRGDGLVNEHIISERIDGECTSVVATGQASFQFKGEASVAKISPDWPGGSGVTTTLTSYVGASGANLVNGSFETEDTKEADLAAGWICTVAPANLGARGNANMNLTPVELQTLTMGDGDISGGYYIIKHTDKNGDIQHTVPLVYNASGSAVQSALRNLDGLGEITVTTTGTTPELVHAIKMLGVTNPGTLATDVTTITGGAPSGNVVLTQAGNAEVMRGARSVQFTGDGAEETAIVYPLSLSSATVYAFSVWLRTDGTVASGAIQFDLVDSATASPTVIQDDEGTNNASAAVTVTDLTTTFTQTTAFFRTPTIMPDVVYLRARLSTVVPEGEDVFMDEMCLVPANELYPGGPFASVFSGPTDWVVGDTIRFTPVNAQAGAIHTWMDRVHDLAGNRLLFPSNTVGTIGDALIT